MRIQQLCREVGVSDALLDYMQRLVHHTHQGGEFAYGLSPRGAVALTKCART